MSIYNNENVRVELPLGNSLITSKYFKSIIGDPFRTLEGAYLTYYFENTVKIYRGEEFPEEGINDGDFFINDRTFDEYRYIEDEGELSWVELTDPLLDSLNTFNSGWIPLTTLHRGNELELLLPQDYLPDNFYESENLPSIIIGFRDLVNSSKYVSAFGIFPEIGDSRLIDKEVNTTITLPIDFNCGLIPTILQSNPKKLEGEGNYSSPEVSNIASLLANYKSYSSDLSSTGLGELEGTSLKF
jgi:hypothetical protein